VWVIVLSALYAIIGEIIFQIMYYRDQLLGYLHWFVILLSAVYISPIVALFRNRFWYVSVLISFIYFVFVVIFLLVFAAHFPIPDDNTASGILMLMVQGMNIISIILGISCGLLVNLTIHNWTNFQKE
jgi:hypothetical protein